MKFNPMILTLALLIAGCGKGKEDKEGADNKNGGSPKQAADGGIVDGATLIIEEDLALRQVDGQLAPFSGTAVWYYETGQKSEQLEYVEGMMEGKVEWWYEDGKRAGEGTKKQSLWDGEYTEWYGNGNEKLKVKFKEGKYEGKLFVYYSDTKRPMKMTNYVNGKEDGTAVGYYETGNKEWEAEWKMGVKHGTHKEFFPDETLKSLIPYQDGKRHGAGEVWYPANPPKFPKTVLAKKMTFANDKLHGAYNMWWNTGLKMKETTFKNGKLDGTAINYHENEVPAEVAVYKDGKQISFQARNEQGEVVKGTTPVPVQNLPQGRTMVWASPDKLQVYVNQPFATVQKGFGNPDASKAPFIFYNNIKVKNPKTPQAKAVPLQLIFQLDDKNKVVKVTLRKNLTPIQ